MQNRTDYKAEIKAVITELCEIRGRLSAWAAETEKKSRRFDTLRDMTPTDEAEADALAALEDYIAAQIDAVGSAEDTLEGILKQ